MDVSAADTIGGKNEIWSMQAYILHNEAMRDAAQRFSDERDRRYAEVNVEREKALKIKETADLAALSLARESQVYKDQQADIMREKNIAASGIYATNADLANVVDKIEKKLTPIVDFINTQQGQAKGSDFTWGKIFATIAAVAAIVGVVMKLNVF